MVAFLYLKIPSLPIYFINYFLKCELQSIHNLLGTLKMSIPMVIPTVSLCSIQNEVHIIHFICTKNKHVLFMRQNV